jgi:hypothetical protein
MGLGSASSLLCDYILVATVVSNKRLVAAVIKNDAYVFSDKAASVSGWVKTLPEPASKDVAVATKKFIHWVQGDA